MGGKTKTERCSEDCNDENIQCQGIFHQRMKNKNEKVELGSWADLERFVK